jgi:hypothetical protein
MKQRQLLTTDDGQPPCVHVARVITRRLAEVEARLAELARAHDQLAALAVCAAAQTRPTATAIARCSMADASLGMPP